jgi:hypothetical protein
MHRRADAAPQTRQIGQVFLELAVCFAKIHLDYRERDLLALDSL